MAAASVLIAAMFFWFARPGLGYYFTTDDVMNLRRAWPQPVWHLLSDCITFSPASYRPFGLLLYRAVFTVAGFHPLPFHLISFGLLLFNLVLLACLARRLTGSTNIGLLAALIGCFHSRMDYLYITTGTIYDIACFALYVGGLVWYTRIRQSGKLPCAWQTAVFLVMYFCALNCKEMATTWPVVLVAYEVLYHGATSTRRWWVIWLSALLTILFLVRKLSGPSVLVKAYKPQYSFSAMLQSWQSYLGQLFYWDGYVSGAVVCMLWLALLVIAVALRSKALKFCWLFIVLGPLPVCFVETRGLYVWYIPLAGWAIYAATLLAVASRWVASGWVRGISAQSLHACVFVTCALLLGFFHAMDWPKRFRWNDGENVEIREFARQISALRPALPRGAKILLLSDPFSSREYTPSSLIQLYYNDATLIVHRMQQPDDRESIPTVKHDIVFAYRNGRMIEVSRDTPVRSTPL